MNFDKVLKFKTFISIIPLHSFFSISPDLQDYIYVEAAFWRVMLQSMLVFIFYMLIIKFSLILFSKTVQKHKGVVFLKNEINFQEVFKVSKNSKHLKTIKNLFRRYFEAGMLDRIFNDIHKTSHK